MHILVTAGNTQTPIDDVRCITNIFTGRTGTRIALKAYERGHQVTLLTSHPEVVREIYPMIMEHTRWHVQTYRTFEDLDQLLKMHVPSGKFDAIVHCAAVSDYKVDGIFTADNRDARASKIKSHHTELWLKLTPTPKLIDRFRAEWNYSGHLVKFKLETGLLEEELLQVAEASRQQSQADWMVANLFETRNQWAYLGNGEGTYSKVTRVELPERLIRLLEKA
jgi:phosphopantothenate-cysteine ligase/phosphopantothenoylcysteine decarboxylase/phosphopantothenate--cysteine ligase